MLSVTLLLASVAVVSVLVTVPWRAPGCSECPPPAPSSLRQPGALSKPMGKSEAPLQKVVLPMFNRARGQVETEQVEQALRGVGGEVQHPDRRLIRFSVRQTNTVRPLRGSGSCRFIEARSRSRCGLRPTCRLCRMQAARPSFDLG
jgi:hypothetical protein